MVRPPRLERGTPGLEGRCSVQLSYGRAHHQRGGYADKMVSLNGFSVSSLCRDDALAHNLRPSTHGRAYKDARHVNAADHAAGISEDSVREWIGGRGPEEL